MEPIHSRIVAAARRASHGGDDDRRRMSPRGDQCRCGCGSMLARIVREGLELKCRRCKSLVLISHEELIAMYRALDLDAVEAVAGERG